MCLIQLLIFFGHLQLNDVCGKVWLQQWKPQIMCLGETGLCAQNRLPILLIVNILGGTYMTILQAQESSL
jgi:hypothetical protein